MKSGVILKNTYKLTWNQRSRVFNHCGGKLSLLLTPSPQNMYFGCFPCFCCFDSVIIFFYGMLPTEKTQRIINIWVLSTLIFNKPLWTVTFTWHKKKIPTRKVTVFFILGDKLKNISIHKNAYQPENFPQSSLANQFSYHLGCPQDWHYFLFLYWSVSIIVKLISFTQRSMGPCLFLILWLKYRIADAF